MNPYFGKNMGEFFLLFFKRMAYFLSGHEMALASDEVQIFVLFFISIASALVGTFLVLKKMTMLANSLSHTILLGIVVAYLLVMPFINNNELHAHVITIEVLLIASFVTGIITTFLTQFFTKVIKLQEDASIGLVFTTLFALGLVLVTVFTKNSHLGIEAIMGNVDALHVDDLKFIFWITLFDLLVIFCCFKEFKLIAFDRGFASSQGVNSSLFDYLLMVLTTATVIGAFRAVGVLLVLVYLVGPYLTARLFTHRLKYLLFLTSGIGMAASLFSVALSRHLLSVHHLPVSTSGLSATVLGLIYAGALTYRKLSHQIQLK